MNIRVRPLSNQFLHEWNGLISRSGWTPLPGVTEFRWKMGDSKCLLEVLTGDWSQLRISACVTLPKTNSNSSPVNIGIFCLAKKNVCLPTMPKFSRATRWLSSFLRSAVVYLPEITQRNPFQPTSPQSFHALKRSTNSRP